MAAKTKQQHVPGQRGGVYTPGGKARKKRNRSPIMSKVLVVFGALLMIVSGTSAIAAKSIFDDLEENIPTVDVLGSAGKNNTGKPLSGAIDLLLLGIDARNKAAVATSRADTIIIVHIPASHDQAYLMSIPRDAKVDIPPVKGYAGGQDRINAAFAFGAKHGGKAGGMGHMATTVTNLTGISFDGVAVIDFNGFKGIVDALGTVNMCIDGRTPSLHYYHVDGKVIYVNEHIAKQKGYKPFVHEKGCREMPGEMALDYSRQRYDLADDSSDYGRQRHQQQLIKAIAKKATSTGVVTDFSKVTALIKAVGNSLLLDTNKVELVDFLLSMKDLAGADMVLLKSNDGDFNPNPDGSERIKEGTMAMFRAAKEDKLGTFVLENPDFINKEK